MAKNACGEQAAVGSEDFPTVGEVLPAGVVMAKRGANYAAAVGIAGCTCVHHVDFVGSNGNAEKEECGNRCGPAHESHRSAPRGRVDAKAKLPTRSSRSSASK
jgi:hypothetical protein